ncbi:hypothetical protein BDR04DRAFT_1126765 [Suillus decipiens]|nr:hypothetical protein BDR04DRAFT_1126765 [Suillus decipiens]
MSNVIDVLSECTLGAYDIGCGFQLGDAFERQKCCMCVDTFHGYAHNYLCQTKNHPNVIAGVGIEDFGTIEHFFSVSNAIAPVIQYASSYCCHQWDEDKYLNLGTMIYNNYKQALNIVMMELIALDEAKQLLGIQEEDLKSLHQEEIKYFAHLGKETEWDVHMMAYVELLLKLRDAEFLFLFFAFHQYSAEHLATIQQEVTSMEVKMGITNQWQPSSPKYQATLKYMSNHQYQHALDNC